MDAVTMQPCAADDMAQLQQEIADDHCRVVVETYCVRCPSDCPMPVWDTATLENPWRDDDMRQADQREVERALRYLDLRGLITRPIPGDRRYVSFLAEAA